MVEQLNEVDTIINTGYPLVNVMREDVAEKEQTATVSVM